MLARLGGPGAHAGIELAHLHACRIFRVEADDPVVAVAAHVDETTAAGDIILLRVEHPFRNVFGVRAGHHAEIGPKEVSAFAMQILVGDEIAVVAHVVEPGHDR